MQILNPLYFEHGILLMALVEITHIFRKFQIDPNFSDEFFCCQFITLTKYIQINAQNNQQTSPDISEGEEKYIYKWQLS